jgi:hypothetical protein
VRRLVYSVGDGLESRVPGDWLWLGRHVKVGDGTQRQHGLCGHAAFPVREIRRFCGAVSLRIFGGPGGL